MKNSSDCFRRAMRRSNSCRNFRHIGSWNFTRRPISSFVRTSPRPAQIAAAVGTTVQVEPEIVKLNAVVTFDIQNAGVDTFRVAVPENVSSEVRFRMLSTGHTIKQRDKASQAENGWVTWTLVLHDETTGIVQLGIDWDVKTDSPAQGGVTPPVQPAAAAGSPEAALAAEAAAAKPDAAPEQTLVVEPPRVLAPFAEDSTNRRRVTLTQTRGEIRLLRHESLSITADSQGDTTEPVDVRELELMEHEGYLAYRYFSQPASATIQIRKHEIHEVAATVVSAPQSKLSRNVRRSPHGDVGSASQPVNVSVCVSIFRSAVICRLPCSMISAPRSRRPVTSTLRNNGKRITSISAAIPHRIRNSC
jgi:hypothetical protein